MSGARCARTPGRLRATITLLEESSLDVRRALQVIFKADGTFLAPAENCEREGNPKCRWSAADDTIQVQCVAEPRGTRLRVVMDAASWHGCTLKLPQLTRAPRVPFFCPQFWWRRLAHTHSNARPAIASRRTRLRRRQCVGAARGLNRGAFRRLLCHAHGGEGRRRRGTPTVTRQPVWPRRHSLGSNASGGDGTRRHSTAQHTYARLQFVLCFHGLGGDCTCGRCARSWHG